MSALPPYAQLLDLAEEPHGEGPPLLVMPFADPVLGRPGFLHGGAITGLLEMAAIVALRHALGEEGGRIKPVNVTVDFMRGGTEHDTFAAATIIRLGKRVANVESYAWQQDRGKPIATAHMNLLLRREA